MGDTGAILRGNVRFETPISPGSYAGINASLSSPRPQLPPGLSAEQIRQYTQSPKWKEQQKKAKSFRAAVARDGTLELASIPPGDYLLEVIVSGKEMDPIKLRAGPGIGKPLARGDATVTVPADVKSASTISLGEIVLKSLATEPGQ